MTIHRERIFARPDLLHDLESRILPHGMDADQAAAGTNGARQWRNDLLRLEFSRSTGAIRLRGDDQVVIRRDTSRTWNDRIEQEAMILAIERQDDRPLIDGVARLRTDLGVPVFR